MYFVEEKLELAVKKELLVKSAARLYSLGVDLEAAREKVRKLAEAGVAYDSREMAQAVQEFTEMKSLWNNLEREYLVLRSDILHSGS